MCMSNPANLAVLEGWMQSYKPEELFDADGRLRAELGDRAHRHATHERESPH